MATADPPALSSPALEVLGALAPFGRSGPHRPMAIRRHTHLTPGGFERAVAELCGLGLLQLEEQDLWMTPSGEAATAAVFA
jgi:hypothetical protein